MARSMYRRLFSRKPLSVMARNRARQPIHGRLLNLLRKVRLRGDPKARIVLGGVGSPGIRLSNKGTLVLPLSRDARREYRSRLLGGKLMPAPGRIKRPVGLLSVTRDSGVRMLLKRRPRRVR